MYIVRRKIGRIFEVLGGGMFVWLKETIRAIVKVHGQVLMNVN